MNILLYQYGQFWQFACCTQFALQGGTLLISALIFTPPFRKSQICEGARKSTAKNGKNNAGFQENTADLASDE